MPRAGSLDTEIAVQKLREPPSQDAYGRPIQNWDPFEYAVGSPSVAQRYWAEVQDVLPSRQEAVAQGLVVGRRQTRIRFRYVVGITSAMQILVYRDDGVTETHSIIGGPSVLGRNQFVEILTERATS